VRSKVAHVVCLGLLVAALGMAAPAAAEEKTFGPPSVPEGFHIKPVVANLHHPTRLAFGPDRRLYVAQQTGEVVAVTLEAGKEAARDQVAQAKLHLLGIALKDDKLWVSDTGAIAVYTRTPDGRYADRREIVKDVPHGLHQNDGFAWGPDGKLYWGLGSTKDRGPEQHPWSGSIMRMNPDGTAVEVFASGFRNPYGIGFDQQGRLWVTDNGADEPVSSDELNLVEQGAHYGYPEVFGMPPAGSPTRAPVALFGDHNSTNGLAVYTGTQFPKAYHGGLFVAMWGSSFDDAVGRAVGFVTPAGKVSVLATGLNRPLDVAMGPEGDLWVADFVPGIIYRIWYDGAAETPGVPGPAEPPATAPEPGSPPATGVAPVTEQGVTAAWVVPGAALGAAALGGLLWLLLRRRRG
jgi:glucose/arabinose dehydrogenase